MDASITEYQPCAVGIARDASILQFKNTAKVGVWITPDFHYSYDGNSVIEKDVVEHIRRLRGSTLE